MIKDIKNRVQACEKCQRAKIFKHTKLHLAHLFYPMLSLHIFVLTLLDPILRPMDTNIVLLSSTIPIVDMLATARALLSGWISRFCTTVTITTHEGTNFESSLMRELRNMLSNHRIDSASYHPQSNRMIERFYRHL
ncbi:transposon Tf2-6 polyprotein [Trichonephila clavipes]|nr:transposon Tf2-6 polyprotein [Trichonephila clavipes]